MSSASLANLWKKERYKGQRWRITGDSTQMTWCLKSKMTIVFKSTSRFGVKLCMNVRKKVYFRSRKWSQLGPSFWVTSTHKQTSFVLLSKIWIIILCFYFKLFRRIIIQMTLLFISELKTESVSGSKWLKTMEPSALSNTFMSSLAQFKKGYEVWEIHFYKNKHSMKFLN